jgi:NAD(P)-dependent dehydrogenase (short-subunit alcohol dehydrogenase family)
MADRIRELFRVDGHRALVTGASSGLGQRFALTLAEAGAEVVVAARRTDKLADLVARLESLDSRVFSVGMDVTDAASIAACFDEIARRAGGPADIIVNNAGVTVTKPLLQHDERDWDAVVGTNLKGGWMVAQEAARRLVAADRPAAHQHRVDPRRAGGGRRGTVCRLQGRAGAGDEGHGARARALPHPRERRSARLCRHRPQPRLPRERSRREARSRIPTRRFGRLEDLDGPLLLLASDAGAHMTGAVLAVDGGHLVSSL